MKCELTSRCWAEIDLIAIQHNLNNIQKIVVNSEIYAVIKADGYGHGMIEVATLLQKSGVHSFGVATLAEAIELREAGFNNEKILLLGGFFFGDIKEILNFKIIPTVISLQHILKLNKEGQKIKSVIDVHLKVDTGMGRFGFANKQIIDDYEDIFNQPFINIISIFSHLASSEIKNNYSTENQINKFDDLIDFLKLNNIWFGSCHLLNSGGIINYTDATYDAVRPGLALYGYHPGEETKQSIKLIPAMNFMARIIDIKTIEKGSGIGYNSTFIAKEKMRIGLVSVGYADGYSTAFSNKGKVKIGNRYYPLIGRVSMDSIAIDLTKSRVRRGAAVLLWGKDSVLSVENCANLINSIPYELVCGVSKRVPRVYLR